jgi:hypothetical protein
MVEKNLMKKILLLLTALLLAGCATAPAPVEFPVSPRMATAYAGGEMTIAWKAESNQTYTVYYTDAQHGTRPDWKPLPQAKALRGEGKQLTITDKVSTETQRRYMLLSGDQKLPY